jgi:hypothetical protein
MRLSARAIVGFQNINSFRYAEQWIVNAGDQYTLYFQLIDLDASCSEECPMRYIAGLGAGNQPVALRVHFASIDCAKAFTLLATQDPNDGSIFSVTVPYTSTPQSGNVSFQLYQGNNINTFTVLQMINVIYPMNQGSDGSLPDNTFFF